MPRRRRWTPVRGTASRIYDPGERLLLGAADLPGRLVAGALRRAGLRPVPPPADPASIREVLVLRDIQHLSIEETSQVLGISAGNVKTRLLRARLQMRDALAPGFDGSWVTGKEEYEKVRPW